MIDTAVVTTDLDRLTERIEKAALIVSQLREARAKLEKDNGELRARVQELESKLQGQDPAALVAEMATLKKERIEWQGERKEVAGRIEAMLLKLEKIEA